MTHAVVEVVVSNFPGRLKGERQVFWSRSIVGWQILRLKFEGGHHALALFAEEIESLLPGGFGGISHGRKCKPRVMRIPGGLLQQPVHELWSQAFVAPNRWPAARRFNGPGAVRF